MLILSSTASSIQVALQNAITTNQMQFMSSYRETGASTFDPSFMTGTTSGTSFLDIVPAPATSNRIACDTLSVYNTDTLGNTVIIRVADGGNFYKIVQAVLLPDESLHYQEGQGWYSLDANGGKKTVSIARSPMGSARTLVTLTSDIINNNAVANTLQTAGVPLPLVAGNKYAFRFSAPYTAAVASTGSRWVLNGPTFSFLSAVSTYSLTGGTQTLNFVSNYNLPAACNATSNISAGLGNLATIQGIIHATNTGDLNLMFASEVASSAITAKAGTFGELLLL